MSNEPKKQRPVENRDLSVSEREVEQSVEDALKEAQEAAVDLNIRCPE